MDTKRFRPHEVLGDVEAFQARVTCTLAQHKQQSVHLACIGGQQDMQSGHTVEAAETLDAIDPVDVPAEVWEAAKLLGASKGVKIVHIYNELAAYRAAAVQQLQASSSWRGHHPEQELALQGPQHWQLHPGVCTAAEEHTRQQGLLSNKLQMQPSIMACDNAAALATTVNCHRQGSPPPPVLCVEKHSEQVQQHGHKLPQLNPATLPPPKPGTPCELQPCGGTAIQTTCAGDDGAGAAWGSSNLTRRSAGSIGLRDKSSGATSTAVVGQLLTKQTVMDKIVESHDERVLSRWAAQQQQWQQQADALMAASGKSYEALTLTRGPEWRRKQELLAALEVAVPAATAATIKHNLKAARTDPMLTSYDNRDGTSGNKGSMDEGCPASTTAATNSNWMSTLRSANERFVQIGNIFSGLFLSLRNTSSVAAAGMTTIRTPSAAAFAPHLPTFTSSQPVTAATLGPAGAAQGSTQGSGQARMRYGVARRRSWSEHPYLQDKLTAGAAALKALQPHASGADDLAVSGWSIESVLATTLAAAPINLQQVEARLAVADPALFREYQAAQEQQATRLAAVMAAEASKARRALTKQDAGQHQGPHLQQDVDQLSITCVIPPSLEDKASQQMPEALIGQEVGQLTSADAAHAGSDAAAVSSPERPGGVGHAVLHIVSTGTAAVYYSWTRLGRQRLSAAASPQKSAVNSTGECALRASGGAGGHISCSGADGGDGCDSGAYSDAGSTDAAADFHGLEQPYRLYLADREGVILPGEAKSFRFMFKSSVPGIFHECWQMSCHPPLEADVSSRRRKGEPITLSIKGVAVAGPDDGAGQWAGSSTARQEHLEQHLAAMERDVQVQGAISRMVDATMLQVRASMRQRQAQQQQQRQKEASSSSRAAEEASAATWAVMNPPVWVLGGSRSSSDQQITGALVVSSCYYYSSASLAQLSDIYGRARAILQPPPPPAEPRKARQSAVGRVRDPAADLPEHPSLPDNWDLSIRGVEEAVQRVEACNKPAGAILRQQLSAALEAASVPTSSTQLLQAATRFAKACDVEATVVEYAALMLLRQVLCDLADAVPTAAAAARASSAMVENISTSGAPHRGKGPGQAATTAAAAAAAGADAEQTGANQYIATADILAPAEGATAPSRPGPSSGAAVHSTPSVTHKAGKPAMQATLNHEQYLQMLSDGVWATARQKMAAFQAVLSSYQAAATTVLDARAGVGAEVLERELRTSAAAAVHQPGGTADAVGISAGHSRVKPGSRVDMGAWHRFVSLRKKEEIELGCRWL